MEFTVQDLKSLSMAARELSARERKALSAMLHRCQSDFCEIIDKVRTDPRCVKAHRFCTMFCALAFRYAEEAAGHRLPKYYGLIIHETAGFIARGEEARIGRRACGYRKRILRHVLRHNEFDECDTAWLCTTISAFLFIGERSVSERPLNPASQCNGAKSRADR